MQYQLAQINISRLIAPIDDPKIAEFVAQLDPVNALADAAPGFVWRLQSLSGNATDIAYNDDPFVIVNMSVWESIDALRDYAYTSKHMDVLRDRAKWFEKNGQTALLPVVGPGWTHPDRRRRTRTSGALPEARRYAVFLLVFPAIPGAGRGGNAGLVCDRQFVRVGRTLLSAASDFPTAAFAPVATKPLTSAI